MSHHLQRCQICIIIIWFFVSWDIRAFRCKVIILSTSITPYSIMINTHSRVGYGPRFLSSWLNGSIIMSISTPTSHIITIVIFISIPTLTSVSKSPLSILSVIQSRITLPIVNSGNCYSYHLTYDYSICLMIYFYNLAYDCFYCCNSLYYYPDFFLY